MRGTPIDRCPRGHGYWLDPGELTEIGAKKSKAAKLARSSVHPTREEGEALLCPGCRTNRLISVRLDDVRFWRCLLCGGHFMTYRSIRDLSGRSLSLKTYQQDPAATPWEPVVTRFVELFREGILLSPHPFY